jgi:hypothetical protein
VAQKQIEKEEKERTAAADEKLRIAALSKEDKKAEQDAKKALKAIEKTLKGRLADERQAEKDRQYEDARAALLAED